MAGIDVSQFAAQLGTYVKLNRQQIFQKLMMRTVTMQYMSTHMTEVQKDADYVLSKSSIDEIVQPFQKGFTPKGLATFEPQKITQRRHKVDFEIDDIDEIVGTWKGFLADEKKTRTEWPLVRYIIERLLIPASHRDRELKMIGKGIYVAPVPPTPSPAQDGMDGYLKVITDGIAGGTINQVITGAITPTNIFDKVEEFVDGIDEEYQHIQMPVFMSPSNARAYWRDKRNTHGPDANYSPANKDVVDFTPFRVLGLPSMSGSDRFFSTTRENFVRQIHENDGLQNFEVELSKREIAIYGDWHESTGFPVHEVVWANDQA